MSGPAIAKVCLLFVLLAVTTGSTSESTLTRGLGGFTAQVPTAPQPQVESPSRPEGYRRIPMQPGVPIATLLRPDDRVVEVVVGGIPFVDGYIDAEREIEAITRRAVAVAVVRVVDKQSRLSDGGDAVHSTLTVDVQSVLKDEEARLVEGGSMSFSEFGGEAIVDGRRVIVSNTYVKPMLVGRTYLVPFVVAEGGLVPMDPTFTFELDNQNLKRQRTDADKHDWGLDKKTPGWAIERVRAKAHLPRRQP